MKKGKLKLGLLVLPIMCASIFIGCKEQIIEETKTNSDSVVWTYKAGAGIYSTPVNHGNNIIFGAGDTYVYAVDKDTQKEVWKFKTDGSISNTPLVDKDSIIISTGATCYSLDGKTGEKKWSFTKAIPTKDVVKGYDYHIASPIIYKDEVIFPTSSGTFFGLNKNDGSLIWEYKEDSLGDIRTTPAIDSSMMVYGDVNGNVAAMDLNTHETAWKKVAGSQTIHAVIASDGVAYSSGRDCKVLAMDIKTGKEKWNWLDKGGSWLTGEMTIDKDLLLVPGSDNHRVAIFNKNTGELIQSAFGLGNIFSKAIIEENMVFFTDGNVYNSNLGGVYAYDIAKRDVVWQCTSNVPIYSTPLVIGDMVYYGGTDGNLYAAKVTK